MQCRSDVRTVEAVQGGCCRTIARWACSSSTDPPYYDNIGYSDLSDFFYVWLRRSLRGRSILELLSTCSSRRPRSSSRIRTATDGKDGAKEFFEDGFRRVFARARELTRSPTIRSLSTTRSSSPKLTTTATASTGWETLLDGMIRSGWAITATWPMRSERGGRMISVGTNALASSIVLCSAPRADDAPTTDRRGLIAALHDELPERCASSSRARSRQSICRRPRSVRDGGVLALRESHRERRHDDDRPLGARADQRDP